MDGSASAHATGFRGRGAQFGWQTEGVLDFDLDSEGSRFRVRSPFRSNDYSSGGGPAGKGNRGNYYRVGRAI